MKKFLILTLAALFVFTGCSSKGEATEETLYFDFDESTFISAMEIFDIDFTLVDIDADEEKEEDTTYVSINDIYTTEENVYYPPMTYKISNDKTTEKVSYISLIIDSNSESAYERFLYHICSVALNIDVYEDMKELADTIAEGIVNSDEHITYQGDKFTLYVFKTYDSFNAIFAPNQIKGE